MHHSCSRAAANACATHLRLLTEPSRLSVLSQIPKAPRGRGASTVRPSYNCLPVPNTCLPISFLVLNDHSLRIRGCSGLTNPPFPKAQRPPLSRSKERAANEISRFRPNRSGFTPGQTPSSQGHVIHAHLTYGNTGETHRGQFPQAIPTNVGC